MDDWKVCKTQGHPVAGTKNVTQEPLIGKLLHSEAVVYGVRLDYGAEGAPGNPKRQQEIAITLQVLGH
jgi:hypothetical protein